MRPVYIVNRNRVSSTRRVVNWLVAAGVERVTILDNASTYPPLLEWYEQGKPEQVELVHVGRNIGPNCFYELGYWDRYKEDYILTDSDVVPSDCCPQNLIEHMVEVLAQHPQRCKVGPSLRTDNLPSNLPYRERIVRENIGFWQKRIGDCFEAGIDTTFALYSHRAGYQRPDPAGCLRTDFPYVFEHWPWYIWPLNDEERYYANRTLEPPVSHIRKFWQQEGVDLTERTE
jgi:hypothetical protein